ncbi:MAG: type II secretion system F family protein [Chthoniobacter sp.]
MTVMVPQLTGFFKGTGQPLPPATQLLIDANAAIVHYWWTVPLGAMAAFAGHRAFTQSAEGRLSWDALVWRIPVFSRITPLTVFSCNSRRRSERSATMGSPSLRALELLEEISGNAWVKARTLAARQAVMDGAALSGALREQQLFPDLFLDMLAVGEQTGRLGETMHHIAEVYERELNKQVTIVSTLIPAAGHDRHRGGRRPGRLRHHERGLRPHAKPARAALIVMRRAFLSLIAGLGLLTAGPAPRRDCSRSRHRSRRGSISANSPPGSARLRSPSGSPA